MKSHHLVTILLFFLSCNDQQQKESLFVLKDPGHTGLDFINKLEETEGFDVFRYRNYYNGGGVGIGDIDNDGLSDVFLVSNLKENRLFLNQGSLEFKDVTPAAGVAGNKPWSTGVAMADVNGDGWLDIYVCNSGDVFGGNRENDLFINNQDGTFTEQAAKYGLNDKGFSTHAAFFDFDKDGDLDCYLLNNSFRPVSSLPLENIREERDSTGGDKLYRNDGGFFRDISEEAGIYGSVIGFGLGITLMDVNKDSWTDIYVSNDFFERDYLYVNQQNGTYAEKLENYFDQTSLFSMGADAGDLNNDGYPEVFVTDMLPDNNYRLKTTTQFESFDLYQLKLERGFFHQLMKNTLQLNNRNQTFSEIGYYSNVSATDWSWGALIFDMDNDGLKDIFVANGVYKEVTNQDFIAYFSSESTIKKAVKGNEVDFKKFNDKMPSTPIRNYAFIQSADLQFVDLADSLGFSEKTFSNGAAYGDLDNDGDQDLIINNLNQPTFLYENRSEIKRPGHHLKIRLKGTGKNPFAVGAAIKCFVDDKVIFYEHYPTRGFQSSMDYHITLGLGDRTYLDSLIVSWPDASITRLYHLSADTLLHLYQGSGESQNKEHLETDPIFRETNIKWTHRENDFVDFNRDRLTYRTLSREGPALAVADINGDGTDDFYFGGAAGQEGTIMLSGKNGFEKLNSNTFLTDKIHEDVDAAFFDADNDRDLDLYVVSGGNEFPAGASEYMDRLYLRSGSSENPVFSRSSLLPGIPESGSCIKPCDYDGDGDMDLFVGTRSIPGKYGWPATSFLLENEGEGKYKDVTNKRIAQLGKLGMVTDAEWVDVDDDEDPDLVIVGEWMPVVIFKNHQSFFQRMFNVPGLEKSNGWWNAVVAHDMDNDGKEDLILGNLGLNSRFKATPERPVMMYLNDFDSNGTLDHVYAHYENDKIYPYALRDDLSKQLVSIKKKYNSYEAFASQTISDIFSREQLDQSVRLEVYTLASEIAYNKGNARFERVALPAEVQFSPIYSIVIDDFNRDGTDGVIFLGNNSFLKPEEGIYSANHGLMYQWSPGESFRKVSPLISGLNVRGDVKKAAIAHQNEGTNYLVIGRNNDEINIYAY